MGVTRRRTRVASLFAGVLNRIQPGTVSAGCNVIRRHRFFLEPTLVRVVLCALMCAMPVLASAQGSPFLTGATALQTEILTWLTPIAIILIMVLGAMAMANRISWSWCIAAVLGIVIAFGAPQIVAWVRSLGGV
jgi:type IV secretion system protein VirB2